VGKGSKFLFTLPAASVVDVPDKAGSPSS